MKADLTLLPVEPHSGKPVRLLRVHTASRRSDGTVIDFVSHWRHDASRSLMEMIRGHLDAARLARDAQSPEEAA